MSATPPDTRFAERLDLALKALTMSRGRLAQEAGVDKSLVSRWVAGSVVPSALNLEKVTRAIARRSPGFTCSTGTGRWPISPRASAGCPFRRPRHRRGQGWSSPST